MGKYQYLFAVLFLICTPVLGYITKLCADDTLLQVGFSKDSQITAKRIKRRHRDYPPVERFLMISYIRHADQKRAIVWIYAIGWWLVLLTMLLEMLVGVLGCIVPGFYDTKLETIGSFLSFWFLGTALSFHAFLVPAERKDPGISDFECGFIAFGVLLGGAVFVVLNALGLWQGMK